MKTLCLLLALLFFFSCRSSKTTHSESTSRFGGIGASILIDSAKSLPYIVDIISGSPAAMAGLRSGDYILAIDGKSTQWLKEDKVLKWLRGEVGSKIQLTIKRGKEEFDKNLKREEIKFDEHPGNFCFELEKALRKVNEFKNLRGLNTSRGYLWQSTLRLPGFSKIEIVHNGGPLKDGTEDSIFQFWATYYECNDSIQLRNKYETLVRDVSDCLKYTCCDSFKMEKWKPGKEDGFEELIYFRPKKIKESYDSTLFHTDIVVQFFYGGYRTVKLYVSPNR